MASKRSTKRKSPCQDTIFLEVNDNDLSPEHHSNEDSEPDSKIMKTDTELLTKQPLENFNLEYENTIFHEKINEVPNDEAFRCALEDSENVPSCQEKLEICEEKLEIKNNGDCKEKANTPHKELEDGEVYDLTSSISSNVNESKLQTDPAIHISFGNKELADLYKFKFIKFLESFVELEVINETDLSITFQRDNLLNSSEWEVVDETFCSDEISDVLITQNTNTVLPKIKKKKAKKKKNVEELFVVDTRPSENEFNLNTLRYSSKFEIEIGKQDEEETVPRIVSNQSCFNCDGNHSLRDCKMPRNASRINAAKNKFKVQKHGVRYHLEEDQKYGHFVPGKISSALRRALGLRRTELPPYIYQMRMLGYPPGWLEEAKFVYSNLDMFDGEGKTVRQKNKRRQGLNPEKIIEYPGYNVPTEKYIKDEYYKFRGVPPYSDRFRKEVMIEYFEKHYSSQQDNYEDCEMDLDANENAVEEKIVKINPIIKELQETTELCLPSPSLVELEKQKENLLLALEDNTSSNIVSEENTSEEPERISLPVEENDSVSQDDDIKLIKVEDCIDLDNSTDEGISDSEKSFTNSSSIKTSVLGTPILKSHSPYSRLPKMDNFTKDVSPVINFENLPNSTGKYEQMTGVLQKVRTQMKNCKS